MKLSEYVKTYRTNHGLSLRQMAEMCHCSYQYLSKLEKNEIETPQLQMLVNLSEGMGISVHKLLNDVDDMTLYTKTYHVEAKYIPPYAPKLAKDKRIENSVQTAYEKADEKTKKLVRMLLGLE